MRPGSSRATIRLEPHEHGTRLSLSHEFADESARDEHIQGWRYQLSLFANVVADHVNAGATRIVDGWFEAWAEANATMREQALASVAAQSVRFKDRFGTIDGLADLMPHIAAAQHFMPGIRLRRDGDVRHCQGTLLVNWVAQTSDGHARARYERVHARRGRSHRIRDRILGVTHGRHRQPASELNAFEIDPALRSAPCT